MPIEFQCPNCGQTLRTKDESAGKKARCPKCQQVTEVPQAGAAPQPPDAGGGAASGPSDLGGFFEDELSQPAATGANPYSAPTPESYSPFAGAAKPSTGSGPVVPTAIDIGKAINHAVEVWKSNLGLAVGVGAAIFGISILFSFASQIAMGVANAQGEEAVGVLLSFFISIVSSIVQIYIGIGQAQIMLRLARGQKAEFGQLFSAGALFLPVLGGGILFGLMVTGGTLLCIIPGIIVAILWWTYYYLIVDGKTGVMESFSVALEIGKLNIGPTILMALVAFGIGILGFIACIVGLIFAIPLISLLYATSYLMMSGQLRT